MNSSLEINLEVHDNGFVTTRYSTQNLPIAEVETYLVNAIKSLTAELEELQRCHVHRQVEPKDG